MTVKQMQTIFDELNKYFNFKLVKHKHFEFNPLSATDEKIDFLLKNNFTHFTFGVQSLNSDVLNYNDRININLKQLKNICIKLEKH
ncbi:hypothetical protein HN587_06400 [Candidatus Woesearchaeota archaeon]|jgi:coproporphyrinogen III oxidase-like Fe-S oxidoreductase|nr:hypothetical protein [Candidatus Woesearchaeota archaeon]